jgi:ADP-ribose pyrophosphatase YjhB (NUDIX family)
MNNKIRVIALAILQRADGKILLEQGQDTIRNEIFYRPMGGGIEFGEKGDAALLREFNEEIGKEIEIEKFLGTVENIFEWQGDKGHQVVLFYQCKFTNPQDYHQDHFRIDGNVGHSHWKSVDDIKSEGALLHPHQMIDLFFKKQPVF